MKKSQILIIALLLINSVKGQQNLALNTLLKNDSDYQIKGVLKDEVGQKIALYGYKNFNRYKITETIVDSLGNFTINYKNYQGMAYLKSTVSDKATSILVLNKEMINVKGTSLLELDSLEIHESEENKLYKQFALEYTQRANVYSAWYHLFKSYNQTSIFKKQSSAIKAIYREMNRLDMSDNAFIKKIDTNFYMSWYLPLRKLINDMPASVFSYNEHITKNIEDFRQINFNDKRFNHSGIFSKLIDTHYWMLENSSGSIGDVVVEMNKSTDYMLDNLQDNEKLMNEVTNYLFHLLEKRNLFKCSEYLALKMLNQNACVLDEKLTNQLESYRAMKEGNTAPDILLSKGIKFQNGVEQKKLHKLSDIPYEKAILVVFGSSWCPECQKELPKIKKYYAQWKKQGVEVLFISLDTNKNDFLNFTKQFPWYSYSDMKGWDSKNCIDYYIFATPTMFLLDTNRNILERILSVEHANTWINYMLNE